MDRRTFIAAAATGVLSALPRGARGRTPRAHQAARYPLRPIPVVSGDGLTLTARAARADVGLGVVEGWTLNGSLPSPTIRVRRGATARIDLVNRLPEPTILHWHGLMVPYEADGHPRWAIDPGQTYGYEFQVLNRAGTYWYHPHTHRLTAKQTYRGMGGLLLVEDEEEKSYELPSGEFEIPLILQDRRLGGSLSLAYGPVGMGPDAMMGFLGDTAFGNGVANPTVDVHPGRYRLRILNACNARILDLGFSNNSAMDLIGGDGGLLEAPTAAQTVMLGPGERADVLVDFSSSRPGERVVLRSLPFQVPGMMMGMGAGGMGMGGRGMGRRGGMGGGMMGGGGGLPQGSPLDLVEFVMREGRGWSGPPLPQRFSPIPTIGPITADAPRRTFRFNSMMMNHTINGLTFELDRVAETIRKNRTEVWTFVNESELPHPVHVHQGHFRVLARRGGRARVMPWETGPKDTLLTFPGESVDVAVRFQLPGIFLLHCHNLEHEDSGMMLNFEVVE